MSKAKVLGEVYDPSRFIDTVRFLHLLNKIGYCYKPCFCKFSAGSPSGKIEREEGKIIDIDGRKIGAYKDEHGKLYFIDNTCTHMGANLNGIVPKKPGIAHATAPDFPLPAT